MKQFLLAILLILLVIRYAYEWIEETFEWLMKPVDRLIKILSAATGLKLSDRELRGER